MGYFEALFKLCMNMNKKRLKILYTIPNFDTAGSGRVLYDLAKGLDHSIFEVHIACSHTKGHFFEEVKKLNLPIHIINTTTTLRPYYSVLNRLAPFKKFIKQHQFDIVHSWHWSSDWTEVLGAKFGGAKFVYTKKAMSWGNVHWKIRSYLADFIITLNDEMKAYFPKKKNQRLIPLGIDTDYYNSETKLLKSKTDKKFKIVTVANLVPVKGIEILIKAIKSLKSKDVELSVLGDDTSEYANKLKREVKYLNLDNQIKFLGKQEDIRFYLSDSDLYVIPTLNEGRKEGMPMALVEAMSHAIPVLGSDISGIKFVLKDFEELLFKAEDSEILAVKLKQIMMMDAKERCDIGQRLRDYVIANFSMETFISQHQEVYVSLVNTYRE